MAELLRSDVDGLGVLCAQAADWFRDERGLRISSAIIEKDFWVTEVLRVLAAGTTQDAPTAQAYPVVVRAVFKGGTSLSKAFRLIERFSEDIDVFLDIAPVPGSVPEVMAGRGAGAALPEFALGNSRVDTIMKKVANDAAAALSLDPAGLPGSRTGTKRGFQLSYPRPTESQPLEGALKEGVVLELVRMGTPTPNASHELSSMLSSWAATTGSLALGDFEELTPFQMDVLAPERTLVDKLCILHDVGCRMADDEAVGPDNHARHFYDVYQLLSSAAVLQSLKASPGLVAEYADVAAEQSIAVRRPGIYRPEGGFAASPAFEAGIVARAAPVYEDEMSRLGFGSYPSLEQVAALVQTRADSL